MRGQVRHASRDLFEAARRKSENVGSINLNGLCTDRAPPRLVAQRCVTDDRSHVDEEDPEVPHSHGNLPEQEQTHENLEQHAEEAGQRTRSSAQNVRQQQAAQAWPRAVGTSSPCSSARLRSSVCTFASAVNLVLCSSSASATFRSTSAMPRVMRPTWRGAGLVSCPAREGERRARYVAR